MMMMIFILSVLRKWQLKAYLKDKLHTATHVFDAIKEFSIY